MFRGVKVEVFGVVENMSHFLCPHCQHEIDIFSKGGVERTARQFGVPYLGAVELDPDIRKGGDTGLPAVLGGEASPHAKSFFEFARKVTQSAGEHNAKTENVIEIR
jgi:ATP-binding protein involved in chromosome partitioning